MLSVVAIEVQVLSFFDYTHLKLFRCQPWQGMLCEASWQGYKNNKLSLQTKIRILEATMMAMVNYGSEAWKLQKANEDLLYAFQRNCLQVVLGNQVTDRFLNRKLREKCGSIPFSWAIMRERLRPLCSLIVISCI